MEFGNLESPHFEVARRHHKYTPHLNSVYAGLGIPPTLTGTYGAAGTTNNFISLKTLTQRLQYGRDVLQRFWAKEIEEVQKAMGFRKKTKITHWERNKNKNCQKIFTRIID